MDTKDVVIGWTAPAPPSRMPFACRLLGLTSLTFLLFSTLITAEFTNPFTSLSYGSAVRLTWNTTTALIPPESYPLFITAQLIDNIETDVGSGDTGTMTVYRMNITTEIDSSSNNAFEWTGIPSPLRWSPEGLYQVELHGSANGTPLAKSPFFTLGQPPYASGTEGSKPSTSLGDEPTPSNKPGNEHRSGVSKRLAFGLGFAIGTPLVAGLSLVGCCLLKRRRRVLYEKREEERRLRRQDFVIH